MKTTNMLKTMCAVAWAAFGISSAAPAHAIYVSSGTGDYATCSGNWWYDVHDDCEMTLNYFQMIKLHSTTCNGGDCSDNGGGGGVDAAYATGRKPAYFAFSCPGSSGNAWELGSCSC
jgi:hypothetical protein